MEYVQSRKERWGESDDDDVMYAMNLSSSARRGHVAQEVLEDVKVGGLLADGLFDARLALLRRRDLARRRALRT